MFKKKWYLAAKGSRNKKPTDNDQIGDFGTDISSAENEFTSRKQALPFLQHKGPNSVTFQLSGPQSFAVVGRNKKIREELNKLPGSRLGASACSNSALSLLFFAMRHMSF